MPLTVGNQYGFVINSLRDFEVSWDGTDSDAIINFLNNDNQEKQIIKNGFGKGIVTIQNLFALKTPIGINIMTIQPPNLFIPGCSAMTGVIETDQIRRDFTFNFKITIPNQKITIKKGDPVGAFIPIPRYFVEKFEIGLVVVDEEQRCGVEQKESLKKLRTTVDVLAMSATSPSAIPLISSS